MVAYNIPIHQCTTIVCSPLSRNASTYSEITVDYSRFTAAFVVAAKP